MKGEIKSGLLIGAIIIIILSCFRIPHSGATENNYPTLIGCVNTRTLETRAPINTTKQGCYYGDNWMNILAPGKQHQALLKKYFTPWQIINRLPIINKESQFDSKAVGYHKKGKDCGLLQVRDIYGGCKMNDEDQIQWLKTRMESQVKGNCKQYKSEERLLRCLYSRHNGRLTAYNSYDNLLIATRNYYIKYYN